MILYHGTSFQMLPIVLKQGLKGGFNDIGGNHGRWEIPILFTSPYIEVAEKYGTVVEIDIPDDILSSFDFEILNDGLGDKCWVLEGEGVLIDNKYLRSIEIDEYWDRIVIQPPEEQFYDDFYYDEY